MTAARLTPGRLTALWVVLRSLQALGDSIDRPTLLAVAARSSLRSGGLPIRDGYRLASAGHFIQVRDETVSLGPLGGIALGLTSEDEPDARVRRLFLSVLFLRDPPPWVAYWQGDPTSLDLVIPHGDRASLRDAELFPESSDASDFDRWAFWQALRRVPLPEATGEARKVIGDAAELLSLEHERRRLVAEGYPDLASQVRWVAQESDAYGFDIASFVGADGNGSPSDPIALEVKGSALPAPTSLAFYLSAHEWEVARVLGKQYVVHLWSAVDPGPPPTSARTTPWLIDPATLKTHIPADPECGEGCRWESVRLVLPIDNAGPSRGKALKPRGTSIPPLPKDSSL